MSRSSTSCSTSTSSRRSFAACWCAAQELTGARYAALGLLNDERDALARFLTVGIDEDERRVIGDLPLGRGVLGELIAHPRILRLADLAQHPHSYGFPSGHPAMKTFLGGPIVIRGEIYGNIYLTEKAGGAEFDEADEELLLVLTEYAAIGIHHARGLDQLESRRDELERTVAALGATSEISRALAGEVDLDPDPRARGQARSSAGRGQGTGDPAAGPRRPTRGPCRRRAARGPGRANGG